MLLRVSISMTGSGESTEKKGETPRFEPYRVRDLSTSRHVVFLFCLLLNVYIGWHFYSPLLDNGWG